MEVDGLRRPTGPTIECMSSPSAFCLAVTLTSVLLTSKFNQLTFVPNCTEVAVTAFAARRLEVFHRKSCRAKNVEGCNFLVSGHISEFDRELRP